MVATATAIVVLASTLMFATTRPRHLPEAVVAVPGAGLLLLLGVVSWTQTRQTVEELAPTVGFLAAVLMLAHPGGGLWALGL